MYRTRAEATCAHSIAPDAGVDGEAALPISQSLASKVHDASEAARIRSRVSFPAEYRDIFVDGARKTLFRLPFCLTVMHRPDRIEALGELPLEVYQAPVCCGVGKGPGRVPTCSAGTMIPGRSVKPGA